MTYPMEGRKIAFPLDVVLHSVVHEGDAAELGRILTFRRNTVDVDATTHTGLTAVHLAVLQHDVDCVKVLLSHGADCNIQDSNGYTPLHTAAAAGFVDVVGLLLLHGADLSLQTIEGDLPADLAADHNMARLLDDELRAQVQRELLIQSNHQPLSDRDKPTGTMRHLEHISTPITWIVTSQKLMGS
ncbi:protein phosphatase 1 regulatory subunit 27-like [Branchiostoma floridae]|uniref:Protein phosphatase 1 regulatory subunit 27-like n=1 Tax=Branchiostoma floridae TaxID=7739 RepID=A0A9J7LEC5_BRAFL|nr:protein phosphatase 1 regulatory subunit 27-like [Branchiostoma floridae]